jgi:hypothetical protein
VEEPSTADDRSGYYLRALGGDEVSHLLCEPAERQANEMCPRRPLS